MTDDMINDLVSGAASAQDADFGSLAIYAALKAATEDRIHMQDNLIDDRPDGPGAPPDRPYIAPPGREPQRFPRRLLVAAAALAFVATGVAGVVFSTNDTPRENDKTTSTTVPEGTIEERIVAAYRAAYAERIEHRTLTYTDKGVSHESWRDDGTGLQRFRSTGGGEGSLKGKPRSDEGPLRTDDGRDPSGIRRIDHCFTEYADDPTAASSIKSGTAVDEMQTALEEGRLVVEGERELDGRDTIRLRYDGAEPREGYLWLDATTLLPFRAEGQEDSDGAFVQTVEFLPRSAENLELLVPPVPAGYTKVDQIHDPDAGDAAGC